MLTYNTHIFVFAKVSTAFSFRLYIPTLLFVFFSQTHLIDPFLGVPSMKVYNINRRACEGHWSLTMLSTNNFVKVRDMVSIKCKTIKLALIYRNVLVWSFTLTVTLSDVVDVSMYIINFFHKIYSKYSSTYHWFCWFPIIFVNKQLYKVSYKFK